MLCAAALCSRRRARSRLTAPGAARRSALLALFTALSIIWSLAPGGLVAGGEPHVRLPRRVRGRAGARAARPGAGARCCTASRSACVVVCGWALLTKVFPGALAADETYARLRPPFDYWNASASRPRSGIPPLLWLGARRSGTAAVNALAWPGARLLLVCLMLSYSRGALLASLVGLAFWFAVVPLRLRGAVALLVSGAGAAPLVAWAFAQDGLTADGRRWPCARTPATSSARCCLMLLVLLVAGLAPASCSASGRARARARRIAGRALLAGVVRRASSCSRSPRRRRPAASTVRSRRPGSS